MTFLVRDSPFFFGIAFKGVGGPLNAPANIFFSLSSVVSAMTFDPKIHPSEYAPTVVSKLSAGRRQLNCAIEMWFADKDQVAVHTLAVAAHQIIHDIHAHKLPDKGLFLNHPLIAPEHRAEFIKIFKEAANFFKHADIDPDPGSTVEFSPFITQVFFIYSIAGLSGLGETLTDTENAYMAWFSIHHSNLANPDFVKALADMFPSDKLRILSDCKKGEFFKNILQAGARIRADF